MPKSKKSRVPNTASLRDAKLYYDEYLRKLGFDPEKKPEIKGRGTWAPDKRMTPKEKTSDQVPGNGGRRTLEMDVQSGKESADTWKAIQEKKSRVAQVYNKGPFMLVSDSKELKGSRRRD